MGTVGGSRVSGFSRLIILVVGFWFSSIVKSSFFLDFRGRFFGFSVRRF